MKCPSLQTIIETPEFIKQATTCMDEVSKESLIGFLAKNPKAGDLIAGTGGTRKLRWTSNTHKGKRGGTRIIYYYHNSEIPIFLLTAYGKNQKENLTMSEKNNLKKVINLIVEAYRSSYHE